MKACMHHKEYSARYGLKKAHNNVDEAQLLAEIKYRHLMGREILFSEIYDIHDLINEMRKLDEVRIRGHQMAKRDGFCLNA